MPAALLARASPDHRARALARACRAALPPFEEGLFETVYADSVVGMRHEVDRRLPRRVVEAVEAAGGIPAPEVVDGLWKELVEPVVAVQDGDWELPADAELALHATWNLLRVCRDPQAAEPLNPCLGQAIAAALGLGYDGDAPERVEAFLARWVEESGLG